MNCVQLEYALGSIAPDVVESYIIMENRLKNRRGQRSRWLKAAVAACLCVILAVGFLTRTVGAVSLKKEGGQYYLSTISMSDHAITDNTENTSLQFSSIREMKWAFLLCRFSDAQMQALSVLASTHGSMIPIPDPFDLYELSAIPAGLTAETVTVDADQYRITLKEEEMRCGYSGSVSFLNETNYLECFSKIYNTDHSNEFVIDEKIDDRNAIKRIITNKSNSTMELRYQVKAAEISWAVLEQYSSPIDKAPKHIYLFGKKGTQYVYVALRGRENAVRPAVEWLKGFEVKKVWF